MPLFMENCDIIITCDPLGVCFLTELVIAFVQSPKVTLYGQLAIHNRVFRGEVRFVEVISMLHVRATHT